MKSFMKTAGLLACIILVFALGMSQVVGAAPQQLRMWTFLNPNSDDPRGQALKSVVDGFNATHPNIKVSVESIHWGKIDALAIQAAAAGEGPDIINIYSVQLPKHVAAGTIQPIDRYVDTWIKAEGRDYLFNLDNTRFDGKVMALPWEMRVWLFWYRKDMLEEAGLPVPKTLNELVEVAGKLRAQHGNRLSGWVVGLSDGQLAAEFMETFEPLLWAAGGQLLDEEGKAAFNSQAGVKVMQWLSDAVNKHGVMGRESLSMTAEDVLSGVKAGTIAMSFEGSMRVSAARAGEGGNNLATAPIPGFTADKPTPGMTAGQTLAIGVNTKHPDAAWEFIKYYLSKDSQLAFAKAGVMPVIDSAYSDPQIADSPQGAELAMWKNYVRDYGRLGRYPDDFAQLSDILVKAAQQIIFHGAPIEKTLNQAAAQYDALH